MLLVVSEFGFFEVKIKTLLRESVELCEVLFCKSSRSFRNELPPSKLTGYQRSQIVKLASCFHLFCFLLGSLMIRIVAVMCMVVIGVDSMINLQRIAQHFSVLGLPGDYLY